LVELSDGKLEGEHDARNEDAMAEDGSFFLDWVWSAGLALVEKMKTNMSPVLRSCGSVLALLIALTLSGHLTAVTACGPAIVDRIPFQQALPDSLFSVAAPRRKRSDRDALLASISNIYAGIIRDSINGQAVGAREMKTLRETSGRRAMCDGSTALTLSTQQAIETIILHATSEGLSEEDIDACLVNVLTTEFGDPATKRRAAPIRNSSELVYLKITPENSFLRFPLNQDQVFASTLTGEIFLTELTSVAVSKSPLWQRVYPLNSDDIYPFNKPLNYAVSSSGEHLAVDNGKHLIVIDLKQGVELWRVESERTTAITFAPEGDSFFTLSQSDPLQIYSATAGLLHSVKIRLGNGGIHDSPTLISSCESGCERGNIASARFDSTGKFLLLKGTDDSDSSLELGAELHLRRIWNMMGTCGGKVWGVFLDGWAVVSESLGLVSLTRLRTGETWHPFSQRRFRIAGVASDEKRGLSYVYMENHLLNIFETSTTGPNTNLRYVGAFPACSEGQTIRHVSISPNGFLLAVQTDSHTFFWNVRDTERLIPFKTVKKTFPRDNGPHQFGFSGNNRFFSGFTSTGKFLMLDLSEFK